MDGPSPAGQVGISIFHFAGPKETALGWIDSVIAKIAANK